LPEQVSARKGVPQGTHAHLLLDRGRGAIEGLLPGIIDDLRQNGARDVDLGHQFWWYHGDHWKIRCDMPYRMWVQTRPFLEHFVRGRLAALPNVEIRGETEVRAPVLEEDRVTGVEVHDREGTEVLPCTLFVDASGRGCRSRGWLRERGYGEPREQSTWLDLCYATRLYRRPPDASDEWLCRIIYGKRPVDRRHGLVFTVEDDTWMFSLSGYGGDHPPADPEGFEEFARGMSRPDLYELMRRAEPISEVWRYKVPSQRWLRFDQLRRLPKGYAIVGDALCSFDPVFGQGITIGALEAELLDRRLERHGELDALAFARDCAGIILEPWLIASIEAFRYPHAQGDRPPAVGLMHRLLDRVYIRCAVDPVVYRAFLGVMQMHRSSLSMLHPRVLLRLLRPVDLLAISDRSYEL